MRIVGHKDLDLGLGSATPWDVELYNELLFSLSLSLSLSSSPGHEGYLTPLGHMFMGTLEENGNSTFRMFPPGLTELTSSLSLSLSLSFLRFEGMPPFDG